MVQYPTILHYPVQSITGQPDKIDNTQPIIYFSFKHVINHAELKRLLEICSEFSYLANSSLSSFQVLGFLLGSWNFWSRRSYRFAMSTEQPLGTLLSFPSALVLNPFITFNTTPKSCFLFYMAVTSDISELHCVCLLAEFESYH